MSDNTINGHSQCLEILHSPKDNKLSERFRVLKNKFISKFNIEPAIYIRVPGRVNLIGEHVDYCGYSVCPMAINQDILLAAGSVQVGPFLKVTNVDKIYPDHTIQEEHFSISHSEYGWAAYVLCGIRGGLEKLNKSSACLRFAFYGSIPAGSGLSSSSALVSSSLLATTYLNKVLSSLAAGRVLWASAFDVKTSSSSQVWCSTSKALAHSTRPTASDDRTYQLCLPKTELATLSAECEHYIGTAGGGMDQAIAFCASEGCAKHIEFNPLRTSDVTLPPEAVFVIAHSLVTKNKAESSDFNTRVVETRLAAQILAKRQHINWEKKLRLADVQTELGVGIDKMISLVKSTFHKNPYSMQEVCTELGVSECELLEKRVLTPDTVGLRELKLYQRALHVVEEAQRVSAWLSGGSVATLGRLLTESHVSLRDLYEASHPQLDRLAADCLAAGALGAKLTGAGWGGALVAVTTTDRLTPFLQALAASFYSDFKGDLTDVLFASQPGPGAQLFLAV